MSSLHLRASLALVLAAFTAACGGGDGSTGPSFADSVSTAEATGFAETAADMATGLAQNMNFGGFLSEPPTVAMHERLLAKPSVAAATARLRWVRPVDPARLTPQTLSRPSGIQLAADGCSFSGHGMYDPPTGDPVDLNENGIPDDYGYEFDCEQTVEGGGDTVITIVTRQRVLLKEIDAALYGMILDVEVRQEANDNYGNYTRVRQVQQGNVDIRSGGASSRFKVFVEIALKQGEESFEAGEGEEWSSSFDPTGTITLGNDLPDGAMEIEGRSYFFLTDELSLSFSMRTTTPLAYNAACADLPTNPPFTAGALLGRLNNSSSQASFEVTFTSCGNYTIDVDGAYDEPMVVTAGR